MNKKFLALSLSMSLMLAACNDGTDSKKEPNKGEQTGEATEVVLNMPQELTFKTIATVFDYNPMLAYDVFAIGINNNTFEGLYRDEENGIEPGVAKSYTMSKDHTVFTFKLREDAKWSNGDPVTAEDFVFAWQQAVDPKNESPIAASFADMKNYEHITTEGDPMYGKVENLGVKAIDEHTLEVTFANAVTEHGALLTLAHPYRAPQNAKLAAKLGDKYGTTFDNFAYNGPFTLAGYTEKEQIVLEKNEFYWDKKDVKLEKITYNLVDPAEYEMTKLIEEFNNEDISRIGLTENNYKAQQNNKEFNVYPTGVVSYFQFNMEQPKIASADLRKAISLAIDMKKINEIAMDGANNPLGTLIPKDLIHDAEGKDFYTKDYVGKDNKQAKKYVQSGLKELGKDKLTLTIGAIENSTSVEQVLAEMKLQIEETLPEISVQTQLYSDVNQYFADIAEGKLDLFYYAVSAGQESPADYISVFTKDHPFNLGHFANDKYEELNQKAVQALDEKEMFKYFKQAEEFLLDQEAAIIPFVQSNGFELLQSYIHDVYRPGVGIPSYKYTYLYDETKEKTK